MTESGFDWNVLSSCQYGIYSGYDNEISDCGEPATYTVWWAEDESDAMKVCSLHFEKICKCERTAYD